MVGSLNSAMTAALLAVRVEIANFYGLTVAVMPLNLYIGLFHIDLPPQRQASACALFSDPLNADVRCESVVFEQSRRSRSQFMIELFQTIKGV